MKYMILVLQLWYSTSTLAVSAEPSAGDSISRPSENVNQLLYDVSNSVYSLNDTSRHLLVLNNNRYCANCFYSINEFIKTLNIGPGLRTISVSLCDSFSLARKRKLAEIKNFLPDFDQFLFQYISNEHNYFRTLSVEYSPAILLLKKGKMLLIPYEEIFDFNTLNISIPTQFKIQEFFHEK